MLAVKARLVLRAGSSPSPAAHVCQRRRSWAAVVTVVRGSRASPSRIGRPIGLVHCTALVMRRNQLCSSRQLLSSAPSSTPSRRAR